MLRIITSALAFLMIAGCGAGTTTRYVAVMPIRKEQFHATSGYWHVLVQDKDDEHVLLVWHKEAIRIVPGVPISICETLDANGNVIRRELARRID